MLEYISTYSNSGQYRIATSQTDYIGRENAVTTFHIIDFLEILNSFIIPVTRFCSERHR